MSPIYPLLGLLARGARHGYELKAIVDQEFAPFWRIDFAQLYRSLARMTREGWVTVRVQSGVAGPHRRVYRLTGRGRKVLLSWLGEPSHNHNEFLVKARFASAQAVDVAGLVEGERRALAEEYAARAETHRAVRASPDPSRLILADAALRETEAASAALDWFAAATPRSKTAALAHHPLTIIGSDDPLLTRLAHLAHMSIRAVGSIAGLVALAQHQANVAGVHLLDVETGEYNIPFIKHLVPEDEIVLVNLALRENGLLVARGNPKNIRNVRDLARRGIRFINRPRGTGTRLLLLARLHAARVSPRALHDWERVAMTHDAIAGAVAMGIADVGPALRAVAAEWNLDFIPLGEERYDLAIPRAEFESPPFRELLNLLHSKSFRQQASNLQGYDLTRMGQVVARIK